MADSVENTNGGDNQAEQSGGRKQEMIGIVSSDKMTKTVVVKVDRMVRHDKYKKIIRRTSKFMAHNEIDGVVIGDKVKIVSTRPLSARKRWQVVEVIQKASR